MSQRPALERGLAAIAAPGTDPDQLARVLAWLLKPRNHLAALRRQALTAAVDHAGPATLAPAPGAALHAPLLDLATRWGRLGVQVALVGDPAYPAILGAGWPNVDAPEVLAWRGQLAAELPAVAIVGARRATGYGTGVAAWLAEAASGSGIRVVSGGALGVDAAAHEAALDGPAGTTVVLGCGHEVGYPRPHAGRDGLFCRVLDAGGALVSELLPWQQATPHHVRARNRIVAGLARVVVVVEGGERSGSLVTATAAVDRDVTVLAVPGDVRAPGSVAPHRLLTEGAYLCTGPGDLIDAVAAAMGAPHAPLDDREPSCEPSQEPGGSPAPDRGEASQVAVPGPLPSDVAAVLSAAWPRPLPVDELAARTGRGAGAVLAMVTRARVVGVLAEGPEGVRLRRRP